MEHGSSPTNYPGRTPSNQPTKVLWNMGCPTSPPRRTPVLALKKSVRGDSAVSLRFNTGSSDHLAPLLGFLNITKATGWQSHSVRGFFAAVVRKKLSLSLVSQKTDGE